MIAREARRIKLSRLAYKKREGLKALIKDETGEPEARMAAVVKLQKMPRNSSPSRVRTRCMVCGRPRAVYKKFKLCRIHIREAMARGDISGMTWASW